MSRSCLILFQCLSPLHAGTGQGVGLIDLPIAREKSTHVPCVPGSSLKGALRAECDPPELTRRVFGPDKTQADEHAGAARFSDLTLLFLPVRSLRGTFAWVTSPYLLRRFARDLADLGLTSLPPRVPKVDDPGACLLAGPGSSLIHERDPKVILEDLDLDSLPSEDFQAWVDWVAERLYPQDSHHSAGWRQALRGQACLLHDDTLGYLLETATEVTARISLDPSTRTVQRGALWYEESLPVESILWGLCTAVAIQTGRGGDRVDPGEVLKALRDLTARPLQLGGNATVGRGLGRARLVEV